jgi:hypothetical protein
LPAANNNPWKKDPVPEKPKEEAPKPINSPFVKSVTGEITSSKKPAEETKSSVFPKKTEELPKKVEEPPKKVEEEVVRSSVTENKLNNEPPKKL